jgi:hypothetical protein
MNEYRKFSNNFKNNNQDGASAKVANPAKVSFSLATLASLATSTHDVLQDIEDSFQERAAIMEHDGGISRAQAELAALTDIQAIGQHGEKP